MPGSEGWFRSNGLRVMSPARSHCATSLSSSQLCTCCYQSFSTQSKISRNKIFVLDFSNVCFIVLNQIYQWLIWHGGVSLFQMELVGFEPTAFRMQSGRATTALKPLCHVSCERCMFWILSYSSMFLSKIESKWAKWKAGVSIPFPLSC